MKTSLKQIMTLGLLLSVGVCQAVEISSPNYKKNTVNLKSSVGSFSHKELKNPASKNLAEKEARLSLSRECRETYGGKILGKIKYKTVTNNRLGFLANIQAKGECSFGVKNVASRRSNRGNGT